MFFAKLKLPFVVMSSLMLLCTGCLKDECKNQYTIYRPIFKSLSSVRSEMKFEASRNIDQPGKIYLYGRYLLLSEMGKGIHVYDNTNPGTPKKVGFLNIMGNVDMAIRNDVLYADSYSDLAIIPVKDWATARPVAFRNQVFTDRGFIGQRNANPDSVNVIVGYEQKDTIVDCETVSIWSNCPNCMFADAGGSPIFASARAAAAPMIGTGGSMARFTLVQNHLYTVTHSELGTFDVSDALNPVKTASQHLGWGIETIFPFQDKLFIGSNTGMFIFGLGNPAAPVQDGAFAHVRSCDPVIADDQTAYVTLRSGGNACGGNVNQMDILDVSNVKSPRLLKSMPLTNPHGLGKDGSLLFVCDGNAGLKVFDAQDPRNPVLNRTIEGIGTTYDVVAQNGIAIVVTNNGIYQYDYSNSIPKLLSKIAIN